MEPGFKPCPYCAEPIREAATVCRYCNRDVTANLPDNAPVRRPATHTVPGTLERLWKVFFYIVLVCGVAFLLFWGYFRGHYESQNHAEWVPLAPRPVVVPLLKGSLDVEAAQLRWFTFTVPPNSTNAKLAGTFRAFGGTGNDIQVIITDTFDFENWKNGHTTNLLYNSDKATDGSIAVSLQPGQYVLAFDNRFSVFSRKQVTGQVALTYLGP